MENIIRLIDKERIILLDCKSKEEVLEKLVDIFVETKIIKEKEYLLGEIQKREKVMSTGIGLGVAVPHARIDCIDDFYMAIAKLEKPIEYGSIDDRPVDLVIMIISPKGSHREYLQILATLVMFIKFKRFREGIDKVKTKDDLYNLFNEINNIFLSK